MRWLREDNSPAHALAGQWGREQKASRHPSAGEFNGLRQHMAYGSTLVCGEACCSCCELIATRLVLACSWCFSQHCYKLALQKSTCAHLWRYFGATRVTDDVDAIRRALVSRQRHCNVSATASGGIVHFPSPGAYAISSAIRVSGRGASRSLVTAW